MQKDKDTFVYFDSL